jgi:hypothetical protein
MRRPSGTSLAVAIAVIYALVVCGQTMQRWLPVGHSDGHSVTQHSA